MSGRRSFLVVFLAKEEMVYFGNSERAHESCVVNGQLVEDRAGYYRSSALRIIRKLVTGNEN